MAEHMQGPGIELVAQNQSLTYKVKFQYTLFKEWLKSLEKSRDGRREGEGS